MYKKLKMYFANELKSIRDSGLYKDERIIESPQDIEITVGGKKVLNFCSNNYLGLSNHPQIIEAAHKSLDEWGYGLSSVRFICGTQKVHKDLEKTMSDFLGTEDTILYAACFDANGGVFEPLLNDENLIITDALNHASLIDGMRLTKARRQIYDHNNMEDLEDKLWQSKDVEIKIIATDGVFSMDGDIAHLDKICILAKKYDALVLVDDSHASGFIGKTGRGTHEYHKVMDKVDIITTTFGKALGGCSGGCTSGRKEIIELLRQKSRPYLFSNTLSPVVAGTTIEVIRLLEKSTELRDKLEKNTAFFRKEISALGFDVTEGTHPITPVMLYDEKAAVEMADMLLKEGIYVIGFSYPVVPKGKARIRIQISAAHSTDHLESALSAFEKAGKKLGVI